MSYMNQQQNQNTPSVYGYSFYNKDSTIDKTMLSFNMWKTTIRMSIYPLIESENDDQIKYDRKGGISIYLTPFKAHMFAELIRRFKENPEKYSGKGVPSGQALVSIESPKYTQGYKNPNANPLIVIRKVNLDGALEASYAYEINNDYYAVINNYDQNTGEFVKDTNEFIGIELDLIANQLESYCEAMNNTVAFAVNEQTFLHLDKIANKLGVELLSSYGSSYKSNSYFTSNSGTTTDTTTSSNTMMGTNNSLAGMI